MTDKIVLTEEERLIAEICEPMGVTYVIATTGDQLQSDNERKDE